jgi:TonB family protein
MRRLIKPKPIWITLILSLFIHFFLISRFNYLLEVSSHNKAIEKSYVARISLKLQADLFPPIENSGVPNLKSVSDFQNIENRDTEKQILQMAEKILNRKLPVEEVIQDNADKKEIIHSPLMEKMENQDKIAEDFTQKGRADQVIKEETAQSPVETEEEIYQINQETGKGLPLNKMIPAEKIEEVLREDKKNSMNNNQQNKNKKAEAEAEKSLTIGNRETEKKVEQEKEGNLPIQSKNDEYFKEKPVQEDVEITSPMADNKNGGQAKKNPEIDDILDFTLENYPGDANPPELLEFQPPAYPKDLRERNIEGKAILKILINKEGKVQEIQIFESSGYEPFDQIAVKSVWQWRFKAARKGIQQMESWVLIPILFQID